MKYTIHITKTAERDLNGAADYIEFTLMNPDAAENLLAETEKKMNSIADFPEISPLIDDPILQSWKIRFTVIRNYLAFYLVFDEDSRIYLIRFLYKKRDWISILKQGFSLE